MKKLLVLFLLGCSVACAEPESLVLRNSSGKAIVTDWLVAHEYTYQISSTPKGSVVIISEGSRAFFTEVTADLEHFDRRLSGMSLQGPPTPIIKARIENQ